MMHLELWDTHGVGKMLNLYIGKQRKHTTKHRDGEIGEEITLHKNAGKEH